MNLRIQRESRMAYAARKMQICVDGNEVCQIGNGKEATIPIGAGTHSVSLQIGRRTHAFTSITTGDESEILITCWASDKGGIEFYSASPCVEKQMDSSKKSNTAGIVALCVVIALVVFFLLFRVQFTVFFFPVK